MASAALSGVEQRYPNGTTVGAYLPSQRRDGAAPDGAAVTTAVVSGGAVTFAGLTAEASYVAYAQVSSEHRYVSFRASDEKDTGSTLEAGTVSIGATAAVIRPAKSRRKSILIQNVHATQTLFVGPAGVATTTGLQLRSNESVRISDFDGAVYGIASGAGTDVRYLEVS